jgi:hypothetical protein
MNLNINIWEILYNLILLLVHIITTIIWLHFVTFKNKIIPYLVKLMVFIL